VQGSIGAVDYSVNRPVQSEVVESVAGLDPTIVVCALLQGDRVVRKVTRLKHSTSARGGCDGGSQQLNLADARKALAEVDIQLLRGGPFSRLFQRALSERTTGRTSERW
jgi:hypothetical protein